MSKRKIYIYSTLTLFLFLGFLFSSTEKDQEDFSERVKISLREVGHQLLLSNQDSTSLVLPIEEIQNSKFKLTFQSELTFKPNDLVLATKNSFGKLNLPSYYRVEVIPCKKSEVAYSYQISLEEERTIIPCAGRELTIDCYEIYVKFTNRNLSFLDRQLILGLLLFLLIVILLDVVYQKKKNKGKTQTDNFEFEEIGSFQFYPEQNKLVKQATEISLSKKECELLTIFVSRPNEIIKREELNKKVWEDNGVFVGRSLDTYISKLRKKLKEDSTIHIKNVHGVGYKLEVK